MGKKHRIKSPSLRMLYSIDNCPSVGRDRYALRTVLLAFRSLTLIGSLFAILLLGNLSIKKMHRFLDML